MSQEFGCYAGVRQGENLSPLLFSLYVNDLQQFISDQGCTPVNISENSVYSGMLKLMVILYADDTVLMSETAEGLQRELDALQAYCTIWKLNVNTAKTKIMIFCKRKPRVFPEFKYNGNIVELVDTFKYLGVMFAYNGSFVKCRKHIVEQATRAMWCLLRKCRKLALPPSVQLTLFDQTVVPVLLYGVEVWGFENMHTIEQLQLKFCKLVLQVKKSTPSVMVYGELGRVPLENIIIQRMVAYWCKLVEGPDNKYSNIMYKLCHDLHCRRICKLPWLDRIKSCLDNLGLSNVWASQAFPNTKWLLAALKLRLSDQAKQNWSRMLNESNKCTVYRMYKHELVFEEHLDDLPRHFAVALTKFRCSNHRLPIELGRYNNIPRNERICTKCQNIRPTVGDEFHFLLECPALKELRAKYVPKRLCHHPNALKIEELMST
jgi:hypothetical protein